MYRFMYCKTLNPLGEIGTVDIDRLDQMILFLKGVRNNGIERMSAGYSVYETAEGCELGKTLLNWQNDGKNIFGRLVDPDDPARFFEA